MSLPAFAEEEPAGPSVFLVSACWDWVSTSRFFGHPILGLRSCCHDVGYLEKGYGMSLPLSPAKSLVAAVPVFWAWLRLKKERGQRSAWTLCVFVSGRHHIKAGHKVMLQAPPRPPN